MWCVGEARWCLKLCKEASHICSAHGCTWCMLNVCGLVVLGFNEVVARDCMMLWMQLLVCWKSITVALMMLWTVVVWVLSISVEASTHLSVLRLMLLARVASLPSTIATNSFIVLLRSFATSRGGGGGSGAHCLYLLGDGFSSMSLCKVYGGFVLFRTIDATLMFYEVYPTPEDWRHSCVSTPLLL